MFPVPQCTMPGSKPPLRGCRFHRRKAYYLKRVSKGYVFRRHPKAWEAILEKPGGGLETLQTWKEKPLLREASKVPLCFS